MSLLLMTKDNHLVEKIGWKKLVEKISRKSSSKNVFRSNLWTMRYISIIRDKNVIVADVISLKKLVEKNWWKKLVKKIRQKKLSKKNRQKKSSKNVFEPCGTQASSGTRTSSLLTAKANHLHAQRKRLNYFFLSLFFCICRHMYHTKALEKLLGWI